MKQLATFLFLIGITFYSFAQVGLKVGHLNVPEILQKLPETDSVRAIIEKETKELEDLYTELIQEYDTYFDKFESEKEGYSELVRRTKETEIREKAAKVQQFNQNANQQIQKRNMELNQPIYEKVNQAITSIATREQFTYVLDTSNGAVIYQSPNSLNITSMVLKELGL
ncbi:MAG: OmpH family outer membrane protein [Mariniphaga sp.]|nr:OmpH family outer membrane protein [Mariniphaga sp.]